METNSYFWSYHKQSFYTYCMTEGIAIFLQLSNISCLFLISDFIQNLQSVVSNPHERNTSNMKRKSKAKKKKKITSLFPVVLFLPESLHVDILVSVFLSFPSASH